MHTEELLEKVLTTVRYEKTLTNVAQELYLSQPYVSKIITDAEAKYKLTLVLRNKKPIELTHAGEVLIESLKKIIAANKSLTTNLNTIKRQESQTINIAFNQGLTDERLSKLVITLKSKFPNNKLNFFQQSASLSEDQLLNKQIDLSIGKKFNKPSFEVKELSRHPVGLLITPKCSVFNPNQFNFPFTEYKLAALKNYTYIGLSDSTFFQEQISTLFKENNVQVNELLSLPNVSTATKVAYDLNTTTITTLEIAKRVLPRDARFNLMMLPEELISFDLAICCLKEAPSIIKDCRTAIYEFLKAFDDDGLS